MGIKNFIKKSISFVSAAAMALTMVAMPVGSSSSYAEETKDPVHVNKTAELQSDGTYKLTLESWAEGSANTTTTKSGTPLDIVLVLDQSGSMKGTKLTNLKSAVNTFVNNVEANAKEYNVDHRIAIAGYASNETDGKSNSNDSVSSGSSESSWINTGLFVNGYLKNYKTSEGYKKVYLSELDTSKDYYIEGYGYYIKITYKNSSWGYNSYIGWQSITPKSSDNDQRNTQVYEKTAASTLTDQDYQDALVNVYDKTNDKVTSSITTAIKNIAASGATRTQYGIEMANQVFQNNPIAAGSNRKRIVVVFTDGQPGQSGYDGTEASSAVSKAYTTKKTHSATVYTIGCYSNGEDSDNRVTNFMNYLSSNYPDAQNMSNPGTAIETKKYYQTTSNASELTKIFENISESITTGKTDATLSYKSIVRDIISNKFELPDNFETGNVEAYTSDYQGNGKWANPVKMSATINVNKKNKTIDVSGFAYDKEYTTEKAIQGRNGLGKKFIVVISNVTATKSGMQMDTNTDSSAIYNPDENGELALVKAFPQPKVDIDSTSYVLDYGKTVTTAASDYGVSAVTKANTGKPSPYNVELKGTYGKFAINNGDLDYTPGKINWDGIDTGYVFGQKSDSKYKWEEVNFMPANSVYYEDDFASTATVEDGDTGTKIIYGGNWTVDGTAQSSEKQSSDNKVQHGWDDSYKDDTNYSNGTAHKGTTGATATFKFTGTGVDIYSRTDLTTGKVLATLTKDGATAASKLMIVDNKAASGTYYQVPTLFFEGLDYGTYEVKIQVLNPIKEGKSARGTYYLDGIRVYNPLGVTTPEKVKNAYNVAGESNAIFTSVRKMLLDAKTFDGDTATKGAVFIDQLDANNNNSSGEAKTATIGTYEKLGPKNEVYLDAGQAIAFKINTPYTGKVFIGAKSLNGQQVSMKVTDITTTEKTKTVTLSHTSDMYYQINPTTEKYVVIQNTNTEKGAILAITKLRLTGVPTATTQSSIDFESSPAVMSYVNEFAKLDSAKTDDRGMAMEKDKADVDIENPDNSKDDNNQETKPDQSHSNSIWNSIMNNLRKWFK